VFLTEFTSPYITTVASTDTLQCIPSVPIVQY